MRVDIIRTKIKEIEESLKLVKNNFPETYEEFASMGLVKDGMYKRLEFCIENVFNICAVINTDLERGIAESDENIVDNLTSNKIISKNLGENLKSMKGFRNILVHRYGKINDELAYNIMNDHLKDFSDFIKEILYFIEHQ